MSRREAVMSAFSAATLRYAEATRRNDIPGVWGQKPQDYLLKKPALFRRKPIATFRP